MSAILAGDPHEWVYVRDHWAEQISTWRRAFEKAAQTGRPDALRFWCIWVAESIAWRQCFDAEMSANWPRQVH